MDYQNYAAYNDEGLLTFMRQGDVAAFTELYNRHFKSLYTVAENILRSPDVSKDIVQEVFTAVWQNRERLQIMYPKAYLQQAVRFQVLKAIRADKTDSEFYKRLAQVSQDMVVENTFSYKELQRTVDELVQSLPDDCRQAFRLSREQNLTYHQIADKLNISVKTVEKKMSQSLRYLRVALHKSEISH